MEKAKKIIQERLDAGEQLPSIIAELKQEGYTKERINTALKEFGLKI